ncbi:hypothetical protein ABK040_013579 [Willaertia magna]
MSGESSSKRKSKKESLVLDSEVCPRCYIVRSRCEYKKEKGVCGNQIFDGKSYCKKEFEAFLGDSNCFSTIKNKELYEIYENAKDEDEKARIRECINEELKKAANDEKIMERLGSNYGKAMSNVYKKIFRRISKPKRKRKEFVGPTRATRYSGSYDETSSNASTIPEIAPAPEGDTDDIEYQPSRSKRKVSEGRYKKNFTEAEKEYFSKCYANFVKESGDTFPPVSWFKQIAKDAGDKRRHQAYRRYWEKLRENANKNIEENANHNNNNNTLLNSNVSGAVFPNPPPTVLLPQLEHDQSTQPQPYDEMNNVNNHSTISEATTVREPFVINHILSTPQHSNSIATLPEDSESSLFTPLIQQTPQHHNGDTISTAPTIIKIEEEEDDIDITALNQEAGYILNDDIISFIKHSGSIRRKEFSKGSFISVSRLKAVAFEKFKYTGEVYYLDYDCGVFCELDNDALKYIKDLKKIQLSTNPDEIPFVKNTN